MDWKHNTYMHWKWIPQQIWGFCSLKCTSLFNHGNFGYILNFGSVYLGMPNPAQDANGNWRSEGSDENSSFWLNKFQCWWALYMATVLIDPKMFPPKTSTLGFHHHKNYGFSPISMIKTVRVQQWWLYKATQCFNGGKGIPGSMYPLEPLGVGSSPPPFLLEHSHLSQKPSLQFRFLKHQAGCINYPA